MTSRITNLTRRDIRDVLTRGFDDESYFSSTHYYYDFWGRLNTIEFLNRLYPLKKMHSTDSRYNNAEEDIYIHTITNPYDYPDDWLFTDDRFSIFNGSDEELLTFICEIFHPEVRDDSKNWKIIFDKINGLLRADKYEMYPKDRISGRDVYSWRDLTIKRFHRIKEEDLATLTGFFNKGGYVLNFSTAKFDDFTNRVIGIPLCTRYNLSKGKSLEQFVKDGTEEEIINLFTALLDYYEKLPEKTEQLSNDTSNNEYHKCKAILENISNNTVILHEHAEVLKKKFSSDYMNAEIDLMYKMQKDNPTETIGKAKELIESCCETILENCNITPNRDWKLNNLVDETMKLLEITPKNIQDTEKEAAAIKAILGSLKGIASNIAIIRNAYGSGHGKSATYVGLQERHAKLAIGSSVTLVNFLWDSFERKNLI